ncbi:protein-glutamate methylesterase/protein-glutamine glutaminase [Acidothermus cellulolyticus]|uniref:protein-glutamate methylesterase/protein-glutamine glutaminase n=1 Tax=Acidothermus cellulolyticus TaxID=28049 RepID=UPI00006B9040|nr:chemotaxis response regulator protein-glutamate methylesterase [Acidothermus cellulolyticus]
MIGVLIVDDSVVIRRMLAAVLDEDPELEVVGTAANGRIALDKLPQLRPDAVVLDVEMPVLDGLATLRELRRTHPRLPVIMFSTVTERGAQATLDALAAGASDYVTKPSKVSSVAASIARVRDDLIPKIKALVAARRGEARPTSADVRLAPAPPAAPGMVEALAIGCSTGGPDALASVVAHLPADLGVPVFVVQHMPPLFTKLFAERLDRNCPMQVREAVDGEPAVAGRIYVAPGDTHLVVRRRAGQVVVHLTKEPPENYCRPSVDVLFRSVASVYGARALACVLTGMGRDGLKGAERIHAAGGQIIVQDEATSVVWGMPGAIAAAGLASAVLPLPQIADALRRAIGRRPRVGSLRPASPPVADVAVAPAPAARALPPYVPAVTIFGGLS